MEAAVNEVVPGTEGTEYEGMSAEEIERAEFAKAINDDPDLDDVEIPEAQEEEPEEETEEETEPEKDEKEEAGEPEGGEQAKPEQKEQEEEQPPTGLEWLSAIPEEQRGTAQEFVQRQSQAIARLEQRVKSHLGQLQPAQRTISQLQQKLRQQNEQLSKMQPPVNPDVAKQLKAMEDKIDAEYKDFPEEADKLKKLFADSLGGLKVLQPASPPQQPEPYRGPDRNEEVQHLATAYSDWGERRFSPEFDVWLSQQADEVRSLLNSPFAADNIALLDAFTNDNPGWVPPQRPEDFHSLRQAQHSPLFRGWAAGEGINPDVNVATIPDHQRDYLLTRFKTDLGAVLSEQEPGADKGSRIAERRKQQLKNRDPDSKRLGVRPGQTLDLDSYEGQKALFEQMVAEDKDIPK